MASKSSKIFVIVAAVLVVIGFVYSMDKDTLFSTLVEPLAPVDWAEVYTKYVIEYSVPITVIEKNGNDCKVHAEGFQVYSLAKFKRHTDLINMIKYNNVTETLIIPCDSMPGDPSEFTIWYVSPDSNIHTSKFEYFIDPYDGTLGRDMSYWNQTGTLKTKP
jgi:hypothetical protein